MKDRRLGKNGARVSPIGIGAMSFTDFYGRANDEESHQVLDAALDLGINHIDTSNIYGNGRSESVIGSYLQKQGAQKNSLFKIASKVGICKDEKTGGRYFNNSEKHIKDELHKTLARLGLDSLELYYIHRRDTSIPIEEVTETMQSLVQDGKIQSFGFSEISPSSLRRAQVISHVAAVQSEYSLSTRSTELGLNQLTEESGTALVAFSPVGRSLLTDSPHSPETSRKLDFLKENPRFNDINLPKNLKIVQTYRELASDLNLSAAGLAIAWLLHQGENIIPIPGTRSVKHLEEFVTGANRSLTSEEIAQVERVLPVGWAHGDRYSENQWQAVERYC